METSSLTERITNLSPAKRALLEAKLKENGRASTEHTITRQAGRDSASLSFAQQRLWFLHQLEPDNPSYNQPKAVRLTGPLDTASLQKALDHLVARHEVLRTTFASGESSPVQMIAESRAVEMPLIDLRARPDTDREAEAQLLLTETIRRPFDLSQDLMLRVMLLRLGDQEYVLLLVTHHIASDGSSTKILWRELAHFYQAFTANQRASLEQLPIQYADFAIWQRHWLQGEVLDSQLAYWKSQLAGAPPVLELSTDHPRPPVQTHRGARQSVVLPRELTESLKAVGRKEGVTIFMALLAAFQTLLYRYTAQDDIVVGSPIAGRSRTEVEGLIGFFVNTLVLRTDFSGNPNFRELLARVREVALGAYAHQDLPFEKLVEELRPERNRSNSPLFQVMFGLQNDPKESLTFTGLRVSPFDIHSGTAKFDLFLSMREDNEQLKGALEYNADLFDASTIVRMIGHFRNLMKGIVAQPNRRLSEIPLLTKPERHQLLVSWNDTKRDYPNDQTVHQLFEKQVEKSPNAVAVEFEGQQLTYRDLNARANQLAHYLRSRWVGEETLVAICLDRSIEMVVGLLGILKAGGSYVPMDPEHPKDRLEFILRDTQAPVLLTDERVSRLLPDYPGQRICLDQDRDRIGRESMDDLPINVTSNNLAYVIYTSGSTGRPKGVMIQHGSVVNFLHSMAREPGMTNRDILLAVTTLSFDIAGLEIFLPLSVGARVVMATRELAMDGVRLAKQLSDCGATMMQATPATWRILLASSWQGSKRLTILCGGEALPDKLAKQLLERSAVVWNMYGPTETTIWSAAKKIVTDDRIISLGRPIANTRIYILDPYLHPAPIGVAGELYIGGCGLARGYLNLAALTAEKFVANPFSSESGSRLYKTGDVARYLPDGNIEFLGRIDHQVKIRGFRIELEEIEAVLNKHPLVRDSVVIAREDELDGNRLVAYVTAKSAFQGVKEHITEEHTQQVLEWKAVWNDTYKNISPRHDPTFNIVGWRSSYTSQPIPTEEMRDWVTQTCQQILSLQPKRVLEIGCGTGLLLYQIAPYCTEYLGTDFSSAALSTIEQYITDPEHKLSQVRLLERNADNFQGIEANFFDLVILNSVVQYFPSVDYLLGAIEGALATVKPGGFIFIGDVRSLPLLEAFHASVQLHQAPPSLQRGQLLQRVQRRLAEEKELVLDPRFFIALKRHFPSITQVTIQPKRSNYDNELTKFRYDVILKIDGNRPSAVDVHWPDWQQQNPTGENSGHFLVEAEPNPLAVDKIPDPRILRDLKVVNWLKSEEGPDTVGEFLQELREMSPRGVTPENLRALSDELGYSVNIYRMNSETDGAYEAVFQRPTASSKGLPSGLGICPDVEHLPTKSWSDYANTPLRAKLVRHLVPQLRRLLEEKLPVYMVPSAFMMLDTLPLTSSGKLDRKALPAPDGTTHGAGDLFIAPRDDVEYQLSRIWESILAIQPIGVKDNFFDLGGHSLLAVTLFAKIEKVLGKRLPLATIFQTPTIEQLASILRREEWSESQFAIWSTYPSSVVPFQTNGSKSPLFWFNWGPWDFRLPRYLGSDQPVYGLQHQSQDGHRALYTSIENMAAYYIKKIRTVQAQGPYYIGGLCIGGMVAFEMARQLQEQGQEVALLVLLDPSNPRSDKISSVHQGVPSLSSRVTGFCKKVYRHLRELAPLGPQEKLSYALVRVQDRITGLRGRIRTVITVLCEAFGCPVPPSLRTHYIVSIYRRAIRAYGPQLYRGRVILFKTQGRYREGQLRWTNLDANGLEIQELDTDHDNVFREPFVRILAEKLKIRISEAQRIGAVPHNSSMHLPAQQVVTEGYEQHDERVL